MLWDVDRDREVANIPHKQEYELWISRLDANQIQAIRNEILQLIADAGDEIATAGWIPGSDWSDTPFHPIYETACRHDVIASGYFFGLLVWTTLMEHHTDYWGFGRYELNKMPIRSMTYFKVQPRR